MGSAQALQSCERTSTDLVLPVTASCAIDQKQRVVVTDFETDEILFDTLGHSELRLPIIPDKNPPIQLLLPLRYMPNLREKTRHLLIQLVGQCGDEQAAGSFECRVPKAD